MACSIIKSIEGGQTVFAVAGRFDGASAWELMGKITAEPRLEVALDFSRVEEFVDYSIAVLASGLTSLAEKRIHLLGIRTHQLRMLRYFGVEPADLLKPHALSLINGEKPAAGSTALLRFSSREVA